MCRAVTCRTCGKTTWAGCGQHVAAVKSGVPTGDWCDGTHARPQNDETKPNRGGFLSKLFGR